MIERLSKVGMLLLASVLCGAGVQAAMKETISFDLSDVQERDRSAPYIADWTATSPDGVTLSANRTVILKDAVRSSCCRSKMSLGTLEGFSFELEYVLEAKGTK